MFEAIAIVAAVFAAIQLARFRRRFVFARQVRQLATQQERRAALARHARDQVMRRAAHDMQVAILQPNGAPDFRRAASAARLAVEAQVPATFRRRQFARLRSKLVEHLSARLQAGVAHDAALAGLAELVRDLAMPAFETDYIEADASGRARPAAGPVDYRQRLRDLHAEHNQRLDAVRGMNDLDPEMREQLIEAEQERFRNQLLSQSAGRGDA